MTADEDGPVAGADLSASLRFSRRVGRRDPRGGNLALKAEEPAHASHLPGPTCSNFMTALGIATPAELRQAGQTR